MYGLESTVLMALRNGLALHAARPFYPADVRAALEDIPRGRVLVTTPVHLRALLADSVELPALDLIVCATAPLSPDMAAQAEARFGAPLHEVYGFTEAGMVATRRTIDGPLWHTLPGVRLRKQGDTVRVHGGHVQSEVAFSDVVEVRDAETFVLHGRNADLVNVAGKRSSLAYLNHHLNSIEGVEDGVFFMPDETEARVTRLTAFVVAPGISRQALIEALRARIDPVYLPRPLYFVESLPRNATGKLPREVLLSFAADCATRKARGGRTQGPA
jgi:acyl-coenzyme A synthetase/AMP-(fatty) acid ligase